MEPFLLYRSLVISYVSPELLNFHLNDRGGGSACTSHITFKFSLRNAPTITILSVTQTGASGILNEWKKIFYQKVSREKTFQNI